MCRWELRQHASKPVFAFDKLIRDAFVESSHHIVECITPIGLGKLLRHIDDKQFRSICDEGPVLVGVKQAIGKGPQPTADE